MNSSIIDRLQDAAYGEGIVLQADGPFLLIEE